MSVVPAVTLACLGALAALPAAADEPSKADSAEVDERPFVPPDGWREKKRGKYTVYCRKEPVMGTRLPKETCYDQEGIRAMLVAQREDREKVDQLRRICSSQAHCGAN